MSFRPSLVPTILVAIGLFILVNLGAWQLRRNVETSTAVARFEERLEAPPLGAPDLEGDPEAMAWHMAELRGQFAPGEPMFVTGRGEFGEIGYDLVHPFVVEDGRRILVNRGWIPREGWHDVAVTPPEGVVQVRGLIVPAEQPRVRAPFSACVPDTGHAIPATEAAPERWPPHSWIAMAERADTDAIVLVEGEPLKAGESKDPNRRPVTGFHAKPHTSPHLEYAATWFLIAATLLVIWVIAGFRRGQSA